MKIAELALAVAATILQICLLLYLATHRFQKQFPAFFACVCLSVVGTLTGLAVRNNPAFYLRLFLPYTLVSLPFPCDRSSYGLHRGDTLTCQTACTGQQGLYNHHLYGTRGAVPATWDSLSVFRPGSALPYEMEAKAVWNRLGFWHLCGRVSGGFPATF